MKNSILKYFNVLLMSMALLGSNMSFAKAGLRTQRPELRLRHLRFLDRGMEISGMRKLGSSLLLVADDVTDTVIYQANQAKSQFKTSNYLDLKKLTGWEAVLKSARKSAQKFRNNSFIDLEGIEVCGQEMFLVNEGARQVWRIINRTSIENIDIKWGKYLNEIGGAANAGFEGVAADCVKKRLYVAKERSNSFILEVDLKNGNVLRKITIPKSNRSGRKVINWKNGKSLFTIGPDIADLKIKDGFLYALARNSYEIVKIELSTGRVTGRVSYFLSENGLYDSGEPFGLAEALEVVGNNIYVGFDNNGSPLGARTSATYGLSGDVGIFGVFDRPKGF
jgi:hypothetical protein